MPSPLRQSYTRAALVRWLDRLSSCEWEEGVEADILETARAIYRKSEVRELHVLEDSVTAYAKMESGNAHSIVEWLNGRPFWRSSLGRTKLAGAIALAGLYELEQLLGDELADCAASDPEIAPNAVGRGDFASTAADASGNAESAPDADVYFAETEAEEEAVFAPRELHLEFFATDDGAALCVPMFDGEAALAGNDSASGGGTRHPDEGAALLRLALRARKAGFTQDTAAGGWRLPAGTGAISRFLTAELPRWRATWAIAGAEELEPLARVLPTPELEVFAESVRDETGFQNDGFADSSDAPDAPFELDFGDSDGDGGLARNRGSRANFWGNASGSPDGGYLRESSFRLRWRLKLGTEWIPESLAQRLFDAPCGTPLFIPGRGMVTLSNSQVEALRGWREHGGGETGSTLPAYALLSLFNDGRLRVSADASLESWRAAFLSEQHPLTGLPQFLRPYQAAGTAWMARMHDLGIHPLLADEMGLGKTIQTLALIARAGAAAASGDAAEARTTAPALVVCPASVVPVWEAEAARFFPELETRVLGRDGDWRSKNATLSLFSGKPVVWFASYATLRLRRASLAAVEFSIAVLDEAQFIKNPDSAISATVSAIRAKHRLALTGTPLENHPRDIWAIFRFLMPGLLGSRAVFEAALETDPSAVARIARQVAPFILRRGKETVAPELPPKVTATLACPMTAHQRALYERIVREGLAALENAAGDSAAFGGGAGLFAYLTRLRQAACDPGLLPGHEDLAPTESGKIALLAEYLEPILAAGRKAVIFSQFVKLLDRVELVLGEKFSGVPLYRLTGATSDRAAPVSGFQKNDGAAVMLASLRAGGSGVTLNTAEYVFLLDPWWNPAVEAQAADRVHRIGQSRHTFVYRMISEDTVESRVEALKAAKAALFSQIVGTIPDMSEWSRQLPPLLELLR